MEIVLSHTDSFRSAYKSMELQLQLQYTENIALQFYYKIEFYILHYKVLTNKFYVNLLFIFKEFFMF